MTQLQKNALARLPLTEAEVAALYARSGAGGNSWGAPARVAARDLCESHERLRAELRGAEILMDDDRRVMMAVLADLDRRAVVPEYFGEIREMLRKAIGQ